eukprot:6594722-Alexandrium_andersonii.AAC.1
MWDARKHQHSQEGFSNTARTRAHARTHALRAAGGPTAGGLQRQAVCGGQPAGGRWSAGGGHAAFN